MAETIIVSSINRNTEYPVYQDITAKYCCGTVKIIIDDTYTEQMLAELPNITINIYTESDGEKVLFTSRALAMAIPNDSNSIESVLIDIPTSCILALIPEFDNNAIISHNSAVCTNNEGTMWTDSTTEFPIQIIWDDTNVYAEQSGGSGGGTAADVEYDNTTSGITATNVQDAIDIVAEAISELEGGVHYIGEVDYYNDLPANPNLGDGYTVKYSGTSGTDLDGTEYVWAKKNNTLQWIDFSKDTYTKTETNNLLNNKQDKIDSAHKLSADLIDDTNTTNKFATSTQLSQIETNKNDILLKANTLDVNTVTANLQAQINQIVDDVVIPVTMEIGGISADGASMVNERRVRTPGYLPTNLMIGTIYFPEGTEHRFGYYYNSDDVSVNSWSDWSSALEDTIHYPEGDNYSCFRILMKYTDERVITSAEIPEVWFNYEVQSDNHVNSISGYYISSNLPAIGKNVIFELSPIIPVQPGVAYKATKFRNTLLFDADLRPTRMLDTADITDNTVPILTGEKYICFCWRNTDCPEMFFAPASNFIEGTVIDDLVPIPLLSKNLSLLGDSISSYVGTIPAGNDVYYTGDNSGVSDPTQMWWSVLCRKTGMVPCVINGWSGSAITQLTDSAHINKVPMSDISRCQALHTNSTNPDVILIAGGVNDYSYAQQASQKPSGWDGKTAPISGNSFDETYAVMIKNIQTAYPNAVIVCLSTWFTMRGTDNGYTLLNSEGLTQTDYDEAIEKVAKYMRVPYINVERCGFSRSNFYPTYAEDSSSIPTHPNARGQRVMGEYLADILPQIINAYTQNVPEE